MKEIDTLSHLLIFFSRYTTVYFLKNKSDAFEKFQDFLKEVEK